MTRVVLDADFLSSFLKIDRLPLLREFYGSIRMEAPDLETVRDLSRQPGFEGLGLGEREAMALALQVEGSALLMNDNQARNRAGRLGLDAVSIPAFLLACKQCGFLGREEMAGIVRELQEKDRYGFRKAVLDLLLS